MKRKSKKPNKRQGKQRTRYDFATFVGLSAALLLITLALVAGPNLGQFVNLPALLIVMGGTCVVTFIKFPITQFFGALRSVTKAFSYRLDSPIDLIRKATQAADVVRRRGHLALESIPMSNAFFSKGLQLIADGYPIDFIRRLMVEEMELEQERSEISQKIFRSMGDAAPAFGIIGTVIGLIEMLGTMADPTSIGPAMAFALLTTLYGALLAHMVAIPIADKLEINNAQERINKLLIVQSITCIYHGQHPRMMDEMLESYVNADERFKQPANTAPAATAPAKEHYRKSA